MAPPGPPLEASIRGVRQLLPRAAVFLDFDGTLAELAPRPELARPRPEVPDLLGRLRGVCRLVAIVSGRPAAEVRTLLSVPGVEVLGHYGLGDGPPPAAIEEAADSVRAAASAIEHAWVEDKGASLAVHFRQAPDPSTAERALIPVLRAVATAHGLDLLRGKMTLELVPPGTPGKGALVRRGVATVAAAACLYAGDDLADLSAFSALDDLRGDGLATAKVAVRGDETPDQLLDAADAVVDGPAGLVVLLRALLEPAGYG